MRLRADCPTYNSLSGSIQTAEGKCSSWSLFLMTVVSTPLRTAMALLVVPRSMPKSIADLRMLQLPVPVGRWLLSASLLRHFADQRLPRLLGCRDHWCSHNDLPQLRVLVPKVNRRTNRLDDLLPRQSGCGLEFDHLQCHPWLVDRVGV